MKDYTGMYCPHCEHGHIKLEIVYKPTNATDPPELQIYKCDSCSDKFTHHIEITGTIESMADHEYR